MKKIVWLSIMALCFPLVGAAQSYDDDLYYTPKKNKSSTEEEVPVKRTASRRTATAYVSPGTTTVVVKDRKGRVRNVDEYNRHYTSKENTSDADGDALYVKEKASRDPDGEWVGNFQGSKDDYEYAERIIRFRNPRYAIPVSSPIYWDVVYGLNSWDWNVYDDGFYAYAFPTFTNRLWWDWRFGSFGRGWGWGYPRYYGWSSPYWGPGWGWGSGWGWGWTSGWYDDPWYGGGYWHGGGYWADNRKVYYNNVRPSNGSYSRSYSSDNRPSSSSYARPGSSSYTRTGGTTGRVVGTRVPESTSRPSGTLRETRPGENGGSASRYEGYSRTRYTPSYTRPSSERPSSARPSSSSYRRSSSYSPSESSTRSTYNRGSSYYNRPSSTSTRRSYENPGSSARSYSPSSSGSYSRPSSSYSRPSGSYSRPSGSYSRPSGSSSPRRR